MKNMLHISKYALYINILQICFIIYIKYQKTPCQRFASNISIAWDFDAKYILHCVLVHWNSIQETRVRVLVEIHVFHIKKSCFQLEDALASGSSRSPNLALYLPNINLKQDTSDRAQYYRSRRHLFLIEQLAKILKV